MVSPESLNQAVKVGSVSAYPGITAYSVVVSNALPAFSRSASVSSRLASCLPCGQWRRAARTAFPSLLHFTEKNRPQDYFFFCAQNYFALLLMIAVNAAAISSTS